jgi:hypothetical protein
VQCNQLIVDLFVDLRNGHKLLTLLEILSQEPLVSLYSKVVYAFTQRIKRVFLNLVSVVKGDML